ncbi:MAG: EthD family reductase [Actinobacteria bacterium]|nr:EthD family reductase [Actinomycetota bacterium]
MYKAVCMFKIVDGVSEEEFEDYFKKHIIEAKALKNLKKYTVAKVVNPEDKDIFYRVNELYYESVDELKKSFSSDLAKASTEDLLKRVKDFKCVIVNEETVL